MKMETHDIPEWAIYYLAYGECDGLTEDEAWHMGSVMV